MAAWPPASPLDIREGEAFLHWAAKHWPGARAYWPAQALAAVALGGEPVIDSFTAMSYFPVFDGRRWDPAELGRIGVTEEQLPIVVTEIGAPACRIGAGPAPDGAAGQQDAGNGQPGRREWPVPRVRLARTMAALIPRLVPSAHSGGDALARTVLAPGGVDVMTEQITAGVSRAGRGAHHVRHHPAHLGRDARHRRRPRAVAVPPSASGPVPARRAEQRGRALPRLGTAAARRRHAESRRRGMCRTACTRTGCRCGPRTCAASGSRCTTPRSARRCTASTSPTTPPPCGVPPTRPPGSWPAASSTWPAACRTRDRGNRRRHQGRRLDAGPRRLHRSARWSAPPSRRAPRSAWPGWPGWRPAWSRRSTTRHGGSARAARSTRTSRGRGHASRRYETVPRAHRGRGRDLKRLRLLLVRCAIISCLRSRRNAIRWRPRLKSRVAHWCYPGADSAGCHGGLGSAAPILRIPSGAPSADWRSI